MVERRAGLPVGQSRGAARFDPMPAHVADETLRAGVVSMAHCWGGLPDSGSLDGDNINLLIDCASDVEAVNAMPRMSAIPVRLQLASRDL
jgi:hypothetical protein